MATTTMKPLQFFVPITRVNDEAREIEGIAFANEVVEGEGGIRLKRTAMEEATPEYMQWGAVREMHQPVAAGTAIGVEWNDQGAVLRAKIVDDEAWEKVKQGVYKGLSVGVAARVMRGKNVEKANWIETSLVDRPKDPDAKIIAFRAADATDEYECEIEEEPVLQRLTFADMIQSLKQDDLVSDLRSAFYALCDSLWSIQYGDKVTDKPAAIAQTVQEFCDYLPTLAAENAEAFRGALTTALTRLKADAPTADITRLQTLEAEQTDLLTRVQTAETELARVQTALTESQSALAVAEERVKVLEKMPAPVAKPPVRYPAAFDRTFTANEPPEGDTDEIDTLQAELTRLTSEQPKGLDAQKQAVQRMQVIKMRLKELGANVTLNR